MPAAKIIPFVVAAPQAPYPGSRNARSDFATSSEVGRMDMQLNGKIALVTGGTSGIGLAAADLFRRECARVVVGGTNPDRLKTAGAQLGNNGFAFQADLRRLS